MIFSFQIFAIIIEADYICQQKRKCKVMKLIKNTKILFAASLFALTNSCTPVDSVIIDTGYYDYYDPFYYGPGVPPPPVVHPLPPAPPPHPGHKPDHRPDRKPDNKPDNRPDKPNKPDNKPGNNIKPDHNPNNNPTINPGNNGHRPSSPGGQPGKRPTTSRRH